MIPCTQRSTHHVPLPTQIGARSQNSSSVCHRMPLRSTLPCAFFSDLLAQISNLSPSRYTDITNKDQLGADLYDQLNYLHPHHHAKDQSPIVVAAALEGQGRGLVATDRISQNERVVTVPQNAIITAQTAVKSSQWLQSVLKMHSSSQNTLPDWTILALWLTELLNDGKNSIGNSDISQYYNAYAAVLPQDNCCIGNVLEWTEEMDMLRGSHLYKLAMEIQNAADVSWQEIQPTIRQAEHDEIIPPNIFTQKNINHSFSLLLSRLIRLENYSNGADVDALCPWADFVNHSCFSRSFLRWSPEESSVILDNKDGMYTIGEQIFASYGQKTNGELLISYGIVLNSEDFSSNPHDACLVEISCENEHKQRVLLNNNKNQGTKSIITRVFPLKMSALPRGILKWCAFIGVPVDDFQNAQALYDKLYGCSDDGNEEDYLSQENEKIARKTLATVCKRILEENFHGKTIEDLKKEIQLDQTGDINDSSQQRKLYISKIILNELRILNRTIFLMKTSM